jgi:hypothetical protein
MWSKCGVDTKSKSDKNVPDHLSQPLGALIIYTASPMLHPIVADRALIQRQGFGIVLDATRDSHGLTPMIFTPHRPTAYTPQLGIV